MRHFDDELSELSVYSVCGTHTDDKVSHEMAQ